jgi:hypothetical protein
MGKTKAEIQKRHQEILVELDKIDELAQRENRPFTKEEDEKYNSLLREDNRLHAEIQGMLDEHELNQMREQKANSEKLRELFKKCREDKVAFSEDMHDREAANGTTILLNPASGNTKGNIEASGAIPMTIHELIDTKVPGLELPGDLKILTGVIGNEVWPYAIDDVEFTVAGEVEPIGEQKINFDKLNASPVHVAAALAISNNAIDNAAFDLYSFAQYKMTKGLAKFKALYAYSHCQFDHALKPVFSQVDVEEITLDENFGKNLALKIADMWDKGFEGDPWLTFDKTIETEMMFQRRLPGQIGDRTVIEGGKCLGHSYTISPYINYALDGNGVPAPDGYHYIGIGHWGYCAFQQHGTFRATVDATSAEVSKRNTTVLTINTNFSISELSKLVNGNTSNKPQAFKLLKVVQPVSSAVIGD